MFFKDGKEIGIVFNIGIVVMGHLVHQRWKEDLQLESEDTTLIQELLDVIGILSLKEIIYSILFYTIKMEH